VKASVYVAPSKSAIDCVPFSSRVRDRIRVRIRFIQCLVGKLSCTCICTTLGCNCHTAVLSKSSRDRKSSFAASSAAACVKRRVRSSMLIAFACLSRSETCSCCRSIIHVDACRWETNANASHTGWPKKLSYYYSVIIKP